MSDQTPRPRRRRIAGEAPAVTPAAKKAPAKKAPAKKAPAKKAAESAAKPESTVSRPKPPSSRVAAAVAARDTGAPTPTRSPSPAKPVAATAPAVVHDSEPRPQLAGLLGSFALLVLGAALAVLGFLHWQGDSADTAQEAEVAAASDAAETIFSFSFEDLEDHATESKALMTAKFAKEYDKIAPALDDLAPQRKVVVTAKVRNAAVLPCGDACSATKSSVLVFVDQDRRLADDDTPTVFGNRIVVDLVKSDGDWKVDDIRAL